MKGNLSPGGKFKAFLTHPNLPLLAALCGMLIGMPTLWTGWGPSDDVFQRVIILSTPLPTLLTRLFVFLDPAINTRLMDLGSFPWWTYEQARVIFFRPLAALSLWLDYQFWPNSKWLMHLHSLLLYGLLCLTAARLYRRLMGVTPQAGLALLLFSLSTAHIGCVVSLAARNLLLTANFGFLTLLFHDRWRRDGSGSALMPALLCLLLSLLSAETGIATCAFLLAYALFYDVRTWSGRILSLIPYALLAGTWLAAYNHYGFGAFGSGFYLSPVGEPLRFLVAVVERFPFLLMGQWVLPDPVVYTVLSKGTQLLFWVISVLVLSSFGLLLAGLIRKERAASFWVLGMLLSVIPICAVSPASGRHLTFVSLGAFALMGQFISGVFLPCTWAPVRRGWRRAAMGVSLLLLSLHLVLYPIAGAFIRPAVDGFAVEVIDIGNPPGLEEKDVIILNAPSPSLFIYFPSYRQLSGQRLPAHMRMISPAFSDVRVTREDDHTLVIEPESGFLVPPVSLKVSGESFLPIFHPSHSFQYGDGLFRSTSHPLAIGERVELSGVVYEVLTLTGDGRPQAVRVQFDQPLEAASLVWLWWDWSQSCYQPFPLPEIGKGTLIPGPY